MGSTWVKAEFTFPDHGARIVIPISKLLGRSELREASESMEVEKLESFLRIFITAARPELSGCSLLGMRLNMGTMCWEVLVQHPSLPVMEIGQSFPEQRLTNEGIA